MVLTVNYTLLETACKNKIKKKVSKDRENIDSRGSGNYGLVKLEPEKIKTNERFEGEMGTT